MNRNVRRKRQRKRTLTLCVNKRYSQNGASIPARLGKTVSVYFCIKSDSYVYSYIHINHTNHKTAWYPDTTNLMESLDVKVVPLLAHGRKAIVTITIRRVKAQDFHGSFYVTALSANEDKRPRDDKLFYSFGLEPAEQSAHDEELEPSLLYLYILLPIVFVVAVVAVIGGVIYRRRGLFAWRTSTTKVQCLAKSRKSGASHDDANCYHEEKASVATAESCVPSDDVNVQDSGHFISEEGLTYITVASLPRQTQVKPKQAKIQQEDNVEYTSLDFHRSGKLAG